MCEQAARTLIKSTIWKNEKIAKDVYLMSFKSKYIADNAYPGQFINVKIPGNQALILRRPFSIYNIENDIVSIIYMVVGKGTESLSKTVEATEIDVLGPLGTGFNINKHKKTAILVGGGCGTPPLYFLAKELANQGHDIYPFLGFGEKEKVFLDYEMSDISGRVFVSTDDDTHEIRNICTHHGTILSFLEKYYNENKQDFNQDNVCIYSCGPAALLSAVKKFANKNGFTAQVSLEEYMGCGFGVCLGCAVKTTDGTFKYVCKDGPVFDINEVEI